MGYHSECPAAITFMWKNHTTMNVLFVGLKCSQMRYFYVSVLRGCLVRLMCPVGLARVVDYLFTHDPQREQLRYMDITEEHHVATYGELRRRLSGASALGYWCAAEHKTFLNPKDSAAVVPGDQMLVLSKKQPKFTPESVASGVRPTCTCAMCISMPVSGESHAANLYTPGSCSYQVRDVKFSAPAQEIKYDNGVLFCR